jgi:tetratricopeptide (TPR) repeat protein
MRAVLTLAAIGLIAALSWYFLWGYQEKRLLQIALEQIKAFRKTADEAEKANDQDQKSRINDLALRHLTQYLDSRPDDVEGLEIEAKLRWETNDFNGAASAYEHLIRAEEQREGPRAREHESMSRRARDARLRLAEIYIAVSDQHKMNLNTKLMPEEAGKYYRYHVAELHAYNWLGYNLLEEKENEIKSATAKPLKKEEAEAILREALREATAKLEEATAKFPVEKAKAHWLYAMALEDQIVPGQASDEREVWVVVKGEKARECWKVAVEDAAILEYENALELMDQKDLPLLDEKDRNARAREDIVAAMRLAGLYEKLGKKTAGINGLLQRLLETHPEARRPENSDPKKKTAAGEKATFVALLRAHPTAKRLGDLYQGSRKNTDIAQEVLDRLLAVRDSVDVRIARYSFFGRTGNLQAAAAELEQAILLDPENLTLILTAAESAMQSKSAGNSKPRFWLDQIPRSLRDDPRVLTVQGMVECTEQKYEAAVATWRKGLKQVNFSDEGLARRLALVLLDLGRDDEAANVVKQYRRLVAKTDPVLRFLEGIQDEHAGRFSRAIENLDTARGQLPESFQTHLHLILARCLEKQGEFAEAVKTYRQALGFDPKSLVVRQFLGRLLLTTQPDAAVREFEQALVYSPNHPALLVNLASARLQEQKLLPEGRRNWAEFDEVFKRASAVVPSSVELTLLNTERLAVDARGDQAVSFLRENVGKLREDVAKRREDIAKLRADIAKLEADLAKDPNHSELKNQLTEQKKQLAEQEKQLAVVKNGLGGAGGRLAEYLRGQGRVDQALEVLTQISDPSAAGDRGWLRIQRALVLTSLGQGREARNVLLRDVDKIPASDRDEVWMYLFLLGRSQGNPETSRAIYNEWARLLPDDLRPKFALLEMDIEANDQNAIRDRLKSLQPHSDDGDFIFRMVQARLRLMEAKKAPTEKNRKELLKDADTLVESVLHEFKIDTVALLLKGLILEAEGAPEKAAAFYDQAWTRGNADALVRLVEIRVQFGQKSELDRLRQNDKTKQLDLIVAKAYLARGDKLEAAKIARQSLAENPGRSSWQVGILEYVGKNEEAETRLRTLAEQQPDKLEPWLALLRFHATHRRAQPTTDGDRRRKVELILEEIEPLLKNRWPDELLVAEYRFAAADWLAAEQAFNAALKRYPDHPEVKAAEARYRAHKEDLDAAEACLSHLKAEANIAKFKPLLEARWPDELIEAECRFAAADWPAADQAFDTAIKRYPQLPDVKAAEARYRTQKGHADAAEARLRCLEAEASIAADIKRRLKNQWPDELLVAECRFAAADWAAADQAFDAAIKKYPQLPAVQAAVRRYQMQKGRPDAAEACLRRLKIEATIAEAKQRVKLRWPELIEAECRFAVADWPAADQAFDDAVKRYPDVREVQSAAALYYEQRGRVDVAEQCLKRLISRNPGDRGAVRKLAMLLSSHGDRSAASKQALELLGPEGGPTTNSPDERLARAIVLGRSGDPPSTQKAIDILQVLLADIPSESSMAAAARGALTQFLLATGQHAEALPICRTTVNAASTPTDVQEACRIAVEIVVACRTEPPVLKQADEILAAALQRLPEADDLLVMKAMIAHFQAHYDEELRLYRIVLSRKPQFPLALNNVAWVLSEGLNQPHEALEKIDKVIELAGRTPNNVDTRGVILARMGRLDQAIDELKWVVQAEPTDVHYYHLAHAYRKMGRDSDFHKAFEEAKRAGLTAASLDPSERADFEEMLKL